MPLPVLPLLVLGLGALGLAASAKKNADAPPATPDGLWDSDLPPAYRASLEATLKSGSNAQTWPGVFLAAYQMQIQGFPKAAKTLLSVSNAGRAQAGLSPIGYPITAESYAQATRESGTAPPGPGVPGPGGTAYGVPPKADVIPPTPPPPAAPPPVKIGPSGTSASDLPPGPPKFVPPGVKVPGGSAPPPGYITVTLPDGTTAVVPIPGGLGNPFPIPPGIYGQPPPTPLPATPPPGGRPPLPSPPVTPGVPPKAPPPAQPPPPKVTYPTGTHTRPDGTYGYTTQTGDYSTVVIAKKFGGVNTQLMAANPGVDWTKNPVGSDLNVPAEWITASSPPPPGPRGKAPPGQKSPGIKKENPGADGGYVEGPPQGDILPGLKDGLKDLGAVDVKAKFRLGHD